VSSVPFILRDHRDDLWRRWGEALVDSVDPDYRELVLSPLGGHAIRALIDDLIAYSECEEYEVPVVLRSVAERITAETRHHLALGFALLDIVAGLHALRGAMVDVLQDALVLGEMPTFGETLVQIKEVDAFLDHVVRATVAAG
jgi:hypothetical protein